MSAFWLLLIPVAFSVGFLAHAFWDAMVTPSPPDVLDELGPYWTAYDADKVEAFQRGNLLYVRRRPDAS